MFSALRFSDQFVYAVKHRHQFVYTVKHHQRKYIPNLPKFVIRVLSPSEIV